MVRRNQVLMGWIFGLGILALVRAEDEQPLIRVGTQPSEVILSKITVSNLRRSYDFYSKIMGLKEIAWPSVMPKVSIDDPGEKAEVCLNFSGSSRDPYLCLVKDRKQVPVRQLSQLTTVGIKTPDVAAAIARARAAGLPVVVDTTPRWHGLVLGLIRDPDGYQVELLHAPSTD